MWIFRYFLPGIFAVALGIFLAQNFSQTATIRFLFWRFYDVPIVLIIAITFVIGFFIRYYVVFVKWLDRKRLERATQRILESHKAEEDLRIKREYSKEIEEAAEEKMKERMAEEEKGGSEEEK
jgi:uncharacterized integral membrane protein